MTQSVCLTSYDTRMLWRGNSRRPERRAGLIGRSCRCQGRPRMSLPPNPSSPPTASPIVVSHRFFLFTSPYHISIMHTSEYDYLFKLLLIGDSGVGKVSVVFLLFIVAFLLT